MIADYAVILVLFLLAAAGITLEKAYFYLPAKELSRRAERGDPIAAAIARAAHYGDELRAMLLTVIIASLSAGLVLLVRLTPIGIGVALTVIIIALTFFWLPRTRLTANGARFAALCSPSFVWLLSHVHPVLQPIATWLGRQLLHRTHTGLYELTDMQEFLDRQRRQRDNRISSNDIDRLQHVLAADTQTVGELMTPRKAVIMVSAKEQISPVFVNELHQTGHALFPVYDGAKTTVTGVLALADIADIHQQGKVANKMNREFATIHQSATLQAAAVIFSGSHQPLCIVVDDHEKYAGILTVGDMLRYIFGSSEYKQ